MLLLFAIFGFSLIVSGIIMLALNSVTDSGAKEIFVPVIQIVVGAYFLMAANSLGEFVINESDK